MYQVQFVATTSADWAEAVELIDDDTNLALVIPDEAIFDLAIGGRCWSGAFTASSDGVDPDAITRPAPNILQWRFTRAELGQFWGGGTWPVGLTMTTNGGTTQLLVGTLTIIDGVV